MRHCVEQMSLAGISCEQCICSLPVVAYITHSSLAVELHPCYYCLGLDPGVAIGQHVRVHTQGGLIIITYGDMLILSVSFQV